MTDHLHLAVALDGYGWHPQAWRATLTADAATESVFSGRYWAGLAATAERGLLDFLTIDDTLMPQPGRREEISPRRLAGRADAVLVAARIAPVTRHIGLVPVATVTHTEPFHISKAIATLDYVSHGRAGWQPRISATAHEAALFGRRNGSQSPDGLFEEAADAVEVVRRLWDSWEDDAVIRDVSTGRFIDRDKLHYIDFTGQYFSVKGPSITPRPPQGQPVVAALAHAPRIYEFAATSGDLVFITPTDDGSVRSIIDEVHAAGGTELKIFADLVVTFGGDSEFGSDALIFNGSPNDVVDLLLGWQRLGIDGARLRPAVNTTDLPVIVDKVVPLLQRAGRFRSGYRENEPLRHRLGLAAAPNRYSRVVVP
jgi:alkanesulfonate monooxygenase SsuD/methylene tetrahydromethanopterin reductase-like flavin-dependent oxidoreductase (luciferase family)